MANEQKIINDVKKAVDGLSTSFKALDDVLEKNMANQKDLIKNLQAIKTNLAGTKSLKEFVTLQKRMNDEQLKLNKTQQAAVDLARKSEQRKQQVIKTHQAAINAAKKEQLANEQLKRSKMQTAAAEERAAKRKEKATRESREASRAYNVESKRLLALTKSAKDAAIQYGINSKEARRLRKEQQALDRQLKRVDASLGQHQRNVGNYRSALGGLKNIMGAAGIFGGTQLLVQGFRAAFRISKEYEKQNAVLAGVLGKTTKEIEGLQKESKRLGATTAFSATQVVELQENLARLGKTESEIIDMTEGIIDATIALGSETGETATLVGATLNAFNLAASDSAHVADVLTLSTQRSALSFEKLNTALPIVAGAARAAGFSLEQTVSMLGQAADRGIDASTSASALRNIFIELSNSGKTLEESLNEIRNSQDRLGKANELFGKRAAVTALALADTTEKANDLTEALENSGGTAKEVAETQLNTLDGQLKLLNSAWEGFILNINNSETALGKFSLGAVKFATNALTQLANIGSQWELIFKSTENMSDETLRYVVESGQAITKEGNEVGGVLEKLVSNYEKLAEGAKETITLSDFIAQGLRTEGETIEGARRIADFYISYLEERKVASEESAKATNQNTESVLDENVALTDLIKIQEELLKQAREMPGTTEREIALRNRKVIAIENEISRLKELGKIQGVDEIDMSTIMDSYKSSYEEMEEIEEEYLEGYLEREERKTEIAKEQEEKRKELRKENEEALYELGTELGNALFERRIEQYNQDLEANSAYYDNLLANQELSEEQRALLEAQRLEKENEIRAKQRQAEKQQFLFNQAMKVGEIWIDTAQKVAAIKATAALLASNPATAAFAPFALAQVPLVTASAGIQTGIILAQSIPAFAKGTDNAPGGAAIVGEKGTELVMSKDKKTAWLTDNKPQLTNLNKGDKVIPHNQLLDSVSNYTNSQIVNNSDKITGNDELIGKLVSRMIEESSKGNKGIIKAIERNKPKQQKQTTIDRMRTDDLKNKLRN